MHQVQWLHYETILSSSAFSQDGSLPMSQHVVLDFFGEVVVVQRYLSWRAHSQLSLTRIFDAFQFVLVILRLVRH